MNTAIFILIAIALLAIQSLKGGLLPAWSLPSYALLCLAGILASFRTPHLDRPHRIVRCLAASAVFFGYIVLRGLFSPQEYIARNDIFMVLAALLVYLVVVFSLTSPRLRVLFTGVLLVLAMVNVGIGAVQFFGGKNFMPFWFLPRVDGYGTRASGFFGCPNHFAGFLEVSMLMGLSIACWSRWSTTAKLAAGYASLMSGCGILMSGSRGAYVSLFLGLIVFGTLCLLAAGKRFNRGVWFVLGGLGIAAIIGAISVQSAFQSSDILRARVNATAQDSGVRTAVWDAAGQQFLENPWIGTGAATYLYFGRKFRDPRIQADPRYAHNDYLQLLGEYGLAGLAGLAVFLVVHLQIGWRSLKSAFPDRKGLVRDNGSNTLALLIGAFSAIAACLVHSVVDFNLHIPANALVVAFIFGILANSGNPPSRRSRSDSQFAVQALHYGRFAMPAIAIFLGMKALPTWPAELNLERARYLLSRSDVMEAADTGQTVAKLTRAGIQRDPRNPYLHYYLGESLVLQATQATDPAERKRLYEESIEVYRAASTLAPQDTLFLLCEAWSLDALERYDEAAVAFEKAKALDPKSAAIALYYGNHFQLAGKYDEAEAQYKQAHESGLADQAYPAMKRLEEERKQKATAPPTTPAPAP